MRRPWLRAAQWLVGLAIIGFAARSLLRNWTELRSQPLEWRIEPGWLVLSALVVWSMYALLIVAWRTMLAGWGQRLDGWTAARIWTVSSLGKYLPGKVWAVAGMALMAQRAGIAAVGGDGLGGRAAGAGDRHRRGGGRAHAARRAIEAAHPGWAAALLVCSSRGAVAGVALLLWPPVLRRLLRLAAPEAEARGDAARGRASCSASRPISSPGWATASALWLLARGLLPSVPGSTSALAIAVFTASYLAGFLALFAPGGHRRARRTVHSDAAGPARHRRGDGAGARVAGAAHDHRARRRGAVSRLLAAETRVSHPDRPAAVRSSRAVRRSLALGAFAARRAHALLADARRPVASSGDDQYVAGYGFRLLRRGDVPRDRPHSRVESLPVRRPAVHRRPARRHLLSRPRGSAGCCRSTPR